MYLKYTVNKHYDLGIWLKNYIFLTKWKSFF